MTVTRDKLERLIDEEVRYLYQEDLDPIYRLGLDEVRVSAKNILKYCDEYENLPESGS